MEPPLQGRYVPSLAAALFALVPYILITSGASFYRDQVVSDLSTSTNAISVISGLSVAGYAFGAMFSGDLVLRFPHRLLFIVDEVVFIIGWSLAASAQGVVMYGTGRILAGFATGMLLVTAMPPVIQQFPPERLPFTAAFVNIGFFGAVAAGPLLGGAVHLGHAWRIMYAGFAGLGVITIVLAYLTIAPTPPPQPDLKIDFTGLALGLATTSLMFLGSGELQGHGFADWIVAVPLGIGLVCFIALMLVEYHKQEPLAPVKPMWITIPVVGVLIAMIGGGAFVTFVELLSTTLMHVEQNAPISAALKFWPQVLGALISAVLLGVSMTTRWLPLLAFGGMAVLIGGGGMLLAYHGDNGLPFTLTMTFMFGVGAGATVAPALFLAGMPLPAMMLGRIFALLELVRSVADFIISPVMLKIAHITTQNSNESIGIAGIHRATFVTVMITIAGTVLPFALLWAGGKILQEPDLMAWLKKGKPALESPKLLARWRSPWD